MTVLDINVNGSTRMLKSDVSGLTTQTQQVTVNTPQRILFSVQHPAIGGSLGTSNARKKFYKLATQVFRLWHRVLQAVCGGVWKKLFTNIHGGTQKKRDKWRFCDPFQPPGVYSYKGLVLMSARTTPSRVEKSSSQHKSKLWHTILSIQLTFF